MQKSRPKRVGGKFIGRPLFRGGLKGYVIDIWNNKNRIGEDSQGLQRAHQTFRGDIQETHDGHNYRAQTNRDRVLGRVEQIRLEKERLSKARANLKKVLENRKASPIKNFIRWIFAGSTAREKFHSRYKKK